MFEDSPEKLSQGRLNSPISSVAIPSDLPIPIDNNDIIQISKYRLASGKILYRYMSYKPNFTRTIKKIRYKIKTFVKFTPANINQTSFRKKRPGKEESLSDLLPASFL